MMKRKNQDSDSDQPIQISSKQDANQQQIKNMLQQREKEKKSKETQELQQQLGGSDFYVVEKIFSKKLVDGKPRYLVKWFGYPQEQSTWEPLQNLDNVMAMVQDFEQENKNTPVEETFTHQTKQSQPFEDNEDSDDDEAEQKKLKKDQKRSDKPQKGNNSSDQEKNNQLQQLKKKHHFQDDSSSSEQAVKIQNQRKERERERDREREQEKEIENEQNLNLLKQRSSQDKGDFIELSDSGQDKTQKQIQDEKNRFPQKYDGSLIQKEFEMRKQKAREVSENGQKSKNSLVEKDIIASNFESQKFEQTKEQKSLFSQDESKETQEQDFVMGLETSAPRVAEEQQVYIQSYGNFKYDQDRIQQIQLAIQKKIQAEDFIFNVSWQNRSNNEPPASSYLPIDEIKTYDPYILIDFFERELEM